MHTAPEKPPTREISRRAHAGLAHRLWSRVSGMHSEDACWLWIGATVRGRYGQIRLDPVGNEPRGKKTTTHRAAWLVTFGQIPDSLHVCHRCDNPRCVNPRHLWLGTHAQNLSDMKVKGRSARGERSGTARLTSKQVKAARYLHATGRYSVKDLALLGSVARTTMGNAITGQSWRHLNA